MSQVLKNRGQTPFSLSSLYTPIQPDMDQVEAVLSRELRSEYPLVNELVRYGFRVGGKRLRPALVILSGKAVGEVTPDHHILAAVVEMIHTATLVHDDVLDEAQLRRHVDTVNARWNNEVSVLLGDFLFTHSFYLASTLESTYACRTIGRATNIVCEGELRQTGAQGRLDVSEEEYFDIIQAKTAELCACSCRLGAHYAGGTEKAVDALAEYGLNLGMAFQITDDVLDLLGNETTTGKSLGTDLEKGKLTLPLLHLLARLDTNQREEVHALSKKGYAYRDGLLDWLDRYQAIEYARDCALQRAQYARDALSVLPPSATRDGLERLTELVVQRDQ